MGGWVGLRNQVDIRSRQVRGVRQKPFVDPSSDWLVFNRALEVGFEALLDTMPHPKKIVLHCRTGDSPRLDTLVEEFIRDGVIFVGVVGQDCSKVEDIIAEIVVGDGSRYYHLLTSNHPDESVEEAVRFADSLSGEFEGKAQVLEL